MDEYLAIVKADITTQRANDPTIQRSNEYRLTPTVLSSLNQLRSSWKILWTMEFTLFKPLLLYFYIISANFILFIFSSASLFSFASALPFPYLVNNIYDLYSIFLLLIPLSITVPCFTLVTRSIFTFFKQFSSLYLFKKKKIYFLKLSIKKIVNFVVFLLGTLKSM